MEFKNQALLDHTEVMQEVDSHLRLNIARTNENIFGQGLNEEKEYIFFD